MTSAAPLIVTARLGAADFAWADALRRAHYPPERNQVPAHLTLFHQLPGFVKSELGELLKGLTRRSASRARMTGVMPLGEGTALRVESDDLLDIRETIADRFHGLLTQQDQQTPRLHITIQNKVAPRIARALQEEMARGFAPRPLAITGLIVWRYLNGPWERVREAGFRG